MKMRHALSQQEFDRLMRWLGSSPERAAEKYEEIRRRLIAFFLNRQCAEAEDLADETINRVAGRLEEIIATYEGEPMRYFYGVANNVALEYPRRKRPHVAPPPLPEPAGDEMEPYYKCLDECLERLTPKNRALILSYYQDKQESARGLRAELGAQMNLKSGALRVRAYRIRQTLEKCINECLRRTAERNDTKPNLICL
jgi:DNA-directed RNA polymerase specialized sigma24 family protein